MHQYKKGRLFKGKDGIYNFGLYFVYFRGNCIKSMYYLICFIFKNRQYGTDYYQVR